MHKFKRHRILRLSALLLVIILQSENLFAEDVHVWTDRQGHRNISTVPPHGFDKHGRLRKQYDPNSIQFQHRQMLRALEVQGRRLELEPLAESDPRTAVSGSVSRPLRAPREGIMGLRELIRLERRGGRFVEQ